ncbi:hypothetical protein O6H91_06G021600 [Diphasiastrum complanatum]|uniref:Uncharacterized protein n=7 Tax=Diphasiastrum complanatum TaxID=34168 RepID=A0ACC2DBB5_DIPCM|nr:hypothetical protein O6H91_06G021600 [Diphasiastrum complanatum]KAJ7551609.1 hypothetical protein O6H91_06G021600 [Diphasiastrum complanatum]KAJ7551610.1 hypothetical protein O6H91_06G021600 [Diphasiastrum complanatum]KAJ7551611.1 hypothetical protein O6H91_06G021600 [Diphasiastrum complanatum]KAJ7551612.1 hypothetical protein O6H91_06G021600 [Diphasiastrum complanatum]
MLKRWGSANFEVDGSKMSRQLDNVRQHRRKLSMGNLLKDQHEDLTLFQDMQKQEFSNFLHLSSGDIEASLRNENLQSGVLSEKGSSDLLIADPDKNDYDWLLTPPETPLFPSIDQEVPGINIPQQGAVRTILSHTSEFHGPQSSLSTKASKGYTYYNMKRSSSFTLSNNEGSLMEVAPSRTVPRARSQPSTPTGNSRMKNAAGRSSHNTHRTVMTSFGIYSHCKVTSSSGRCSPSARGVSPSKRSQTPPYQMRQLSLSRVPPPNLRTAISDRSDSSRSTSAHLRHKRDASVARVNSHSTWMDSNNHLRWSTVSASPSISCSSPTSLDRECLSPNSSRGSVTSQFDEVQAVCLTTDLGPDERRILRSYNSAFEQLSNLQLKQQVSLGSPQINFQPFMPDSPTSFSSNASSSLQYSSSSNSILIFAAQSERSESGANESDGSHGGDGLFSDVHKDTQSKESSFSHREKDDLLTERFNIKMHQENLNISHTSELNCLFATEHASKRELILQKDSDPYTHNTVAVESVDDHGLYLPGSSYLSSVQGLQLVTGGGADMINEEDNISCTLAFQRAQNILKLWCSSQLDPQRQSASLELRLNLKDDKVLEKLEQCPRLELVGGETCCTGPNARHASAIVTLGSAEESMSMNMEPAARTFGALQNSGYGIQSSNGRQEGKREVWRGKKFGAHNLAKEHTDFDKFACSTEIWPGVGKGISPTSVSVEHVPSTSEEMFLVEGSGVNAISGEDCALMPATKRNDNEEISATGDNTVQNICNGDGKETLQSEVIKPKACKQIGEQSPLSLEKQDTAENGLTFGTDFPDRATGMTSNGEIHYSLTGNDVAKAAKLFQKNIDERFLDYGLDSLQVPEFRNKFSAESALYHMETKQRGNDYPQLCLEVETEGFDFCTTCTIVKDEVCCSEKKTPVMNDKMPTDSDALVLTDDTKSQNNMPFVSHASGKNEEVRVLDLQPLSSTISETFNLVFHLTSNHPSKLTACRENVVANATTASADYHGEGEKYGTRMQLVEPILSGSSLNEGENLDTGMQLIESILSRSSSNALNDESSFYHSNAAVSGDSITTNVFAPSPGTNTHVCASSSSLLWDKRLLEATDTILFCSSIVHDITYKASTLAIEQDASKLVTFPAATNKDLPVFFKGIKKQNGIRGKAAKGCKIQGLGADQITRQKLIYMQQQNRINSTIVSHPENSAMQIDVKQQEEPVITVIKSNQTKEMPRNGQPKCRCTIL